MAGLSFDPDSVKDGLRLGALESTPCASTLTVETGVERYRTRSSKESAILVRSISNS